MFDFSFGELALVAVIAIIALGPKDIPRIAFQIGKWLKQFNYTKYTLERQFDLFMDKETKKRDPDALNIKDEPATKETLSDE